MFAGYVAAGLYYCFYFLQRKTSKKKILAVREDVTRYRDNTRGVLKQYYNNIIMLVSSRVAVANLKSNSSDSNDVYT